MIPEMMQHARRERVKQEGRDRYKNNPDESFFEVMNPYPPSLVEYGYWRDGWEEAFEEDRKKPTTLTITFVMPPESSMLNPLLEFWLKYPVKKSTITQVGFNELHPKIEVRCDNVPKS